MPKKSLVGSDSVQKFSNSLRITLWMTRRKVQVMDRWSKKADVLMSTSGIWMVAPPFFLIRSMREIRSNQRENAKPPKSSGNGNKRKLVIGVYFPKL